MRTFHYERATLTEGAIHSGAKPGTKFLAGGTNLVDLMKDGVESPTTLVDINHLNLTQIQSDSTGAVMIGALVRNSDLADHAVIKTNYPLLSQALLNGLRRNCAIWRLPVEICFSGHAATTSRM